MVCDASVAVSMALSSMPGCSVGSVSKFTCRCSLIDVFEAQGLCPLRNGWVRDEAVTLAIRDRRRIERRVTASVSAYDPRPDVKSRRAWRVVEEAGS
jgi:hypothetical protein